MEQNNKIERSEIWKQIYELVKQIPRQETTDDAPDAFSVTTELEILFLKLISKQYVKQQSEFLLQAYKEGFDGATASLIAANKIVQERKIQ